jgi:tyrosine-specific transport protein
MKLIYATAILSGTIIGAGLFALPYVTLKLGFWVMLGYFVVLGSLAILIHLIFAKLALKTPDFKRLPGFAKIYLGRKGEIIAYTSTILGLFGALLAYLILGGEFLMGLLSSYFGGSLLFYIFLYFIAGSILIFFGIKAIARVEFWGITLFLIILSAIFFRGQEFIEVKNLFIGSWQSGNENFFLPYGVILFSLWGAALIPEIEEMLGKHKKVVTRIIPIAISISIAIYLFFIYIVLGITGPETAESALLGLKTVLGNEIVALALLFGLLTTFTSFITLGLTLKKVLWYDLKFSRITALSITCFVPLILYLLGFDNFITVIGSVGGIMLAVDGILILLMYKKLEGKKWLVYPLMFLLLIGIVYSLIYFS